MAIDPSAAFKKAITEQLPNAKISVDAFHLVQLADPGAAAAGTRPGARRGHSVVPAWANRRLLLRGYDTLSVRAPVRLQGVFATDDRTDELSAAWGVKEQLRRLLKVPTLDQAQQDKMILGCCVLAADMEETWRLWATIEAWWLAIEVLIAHRVTNARTEAANTTIKHIKPTAGIPKSNALPNPYPAHQRRPTRGVNSLTQQGTTVNCE